LHGALVLLVGWVLDHRQEVLVTVHAAAVLGWAGPGAIDAERILLAHLPRQDCLQPHLVLPPVAEVVLVGDGYSGAEKVAGDRDLPARQRGRVALVGAIV